MNTQTLPYRLRWWIEDIGLEATLALLQARGGEQVQVPSSTGKKSWWIEFISKEDIKKVQIRYGAGETIKLPKPDKILQKARNEAIAKDRSNGLSLNLLSRKYKLTQQGVLFILSKIKNQDEYEKNQKSLF